MKAHKRAIKRIFSEKRRNKFMRIRTHLLRNFSKWSNVDTYFLRGEDGWSFWLRVKFFSCFFLSFPFSLVLLKYGSNFWHFFFIECIISSDEIHRKLLSFAYKYLTKWNNAKIASKRASHGIQRENENEVKNERKNERKKLEWQHWFIFAFFHRIQKHLKYVCP